MPTFRRLLIDCTHTLQGGFRTGVQRVVRRVCEESLDAKNDLFEKCIPVVQNGSKFTRVKVKKEPSGSFQFQYESLDPNRDILAGAPRWYRPSMEAVCAVARWPKLRRWLLPEPGRMGIFKLPAKIARTLSPNHGGNIRPTEGDLLLLPDAYWAYPHIWPAVERSRSQGARIATVIYDLIPLTHSHLYDEPGVNVFRQYLKEVLARSEVLLTISQTVREQVLELLPEMLEVSQISQPVIPIRLGAEFSVGDGVPRTELRELFAESSSPRPFLVVGTIEIRKNHILALRAMEKLWSEVPNAKLVIAGCLGWRAEQFMDIARDHPELGKRLFLFHDLSDAEIDFCYRQCQAVIFPSVTEGFGLPIVEALHRGRQVIASDIGIHHEVGGSLCDYFSLGDSHELARLLKSAASRSADAGSAQTSDSANERHFTWNSAVTTMHRNLHLTFSKDLQGSTAPSVPHAKAA